VPVPVSSRNDLEHLAIELLRHEIPIPKPIRILGVSLSSLTIQDREEPQLGLPI
jgi:DNA polymerase-4